MNESIAVRTFIFEGKLHSKWCHSSAPVMSSQSGIYFACNSNCVLA
ncbi:hypothetical protein [Wolbachia endosymbiont of Cardiocondyla obscurior]|nr:hypothetical protein [Wolbachia endosymbiont of Cardiocondyla obscurior]